ncbi:MAG: stage III sporulation protein AB [Lachnospiraceae bacterium]|nr:stage III sporulation protein AB [Lachnospiraceae bacterium]
MIKLIGAVMVLISAYAIGSLLALRVKEQEKWLKDMKTTLFLLLGELEYRQMPLPDAMERISNRHGGYLSAFFQVLSEEMRKKEGYTLQELWYRVAEPVFKNSPLSKTQAEEFAELGLYFTESDKKTRREALDFYLNRLEEEIVQLREKGADKAYLCRTLGMLGGIFLLIMVL